MSRFLRARRLGGPRGVVLLALLTLAISISAWGCVNGSMG